MTTPYLRALEKLQRQWHRQFKRNDWEGCREIRAAIDELNSIRFSP